MRHRVLVVVSGCFLLAQSVLGSQLYAITDLGPGRALAINNQGQVLGYDTVGSYLFSNGQKQYLPQPSGGTFSATALNDLGQVAGYVNYAGQLNYDLASYSQGTLTVRADVPGVAPIGLSDNGVVTGIGIFNYKGFVYANGALTTIDSLPRAINATGTIVAVSNSGALVYKDGQSSVLKPPSGANGLSPEGISNSGEIVGELSTSSPSLPYQAFTCKDGQFQALPSVFRDPIELNIANAVNDAGVAVGNSEIRSGVYAWSYDPTTGFSQLSNSLTTSGWLLSSAQGINDLGEIIGDGQFGDLRAPLSGYLLTPLTTPEPASVGLVITGFLTAVGWSVRSGVGKAALQVLSHE